MLSKNEIARRIETETGVKPNLVKTVLDGLATVAADEIGAGEDFTVPGVARISWAYRAPKKKGEKWKKGDTVTGFGGVEAVKDADSPPVTEQVKLRAKAVGAIHRLAPRSNDAVSQRDFMRGKAGKNIRSKKRK